MALPPQLQRYEFGKRSSLAAAASTATPRRSAPPAASAAATSGGPVGRSDNQAAAVALAGAKRELGAFLAAEADPQDKQTASQAMALLNRIAR